MSGQSIDEMARETAARAAEYLSEHGWTQGVLHDEEGRACAVGAIQATHQVTPLTWDCGGRRAFRESKGHLFSLIRDAIGGSGHVSEIPDWNDAPERTAEDVILMFKRIGAGG